jgi:hypothetical protein
MTSMVLKDSALESLTPSVNAPLKFCKSIGNVTMSLYPLKKERKSCEW